MKNKILIIPILFFGILLLNSCYKDSPLYNEPVDGEGVNTVLLSQPAMDVVVDAATEKTSFNISVALWGPTLSTDITIPFQIDETNLEASAYEVSDSKITIKAGSNSGILKIDLVSAEMFPGEVFTIKYSLGKPSVGELSKQASNGVITTYNPGLLGPWVGTYTVTAVSYGSPGDWDEEWAVTTALDPDQPLTNITITGIGGGTEPVVATIDVDAGTITIAHGQSCGAPYGYGTTATTVILGDADSNVYPSADLVGTVNAETGEILIDFIGLQFVDGDYTGYVWDVFNCTFSKDAKSTTNYVPEVKKISKR